jgi:hypothetical protein
MDKEQVRQHRLFRKIAMASPSTDIQALAHTLIFTKAGDRQGVPPPTTSGINPTQKAYRWPGHRTNNDHRLACLAVLTQCGRSAEQRFEPWEAFILTFAILCFPGLEQLIRQESAALQVEDLPEVFIEAVIEGGRTLMTPPPAGEEPTLFVNIPLPEHLPSYTAVLDVHLINASKIEGIYGYYSLLLFLAGKKITVDNISSVTDRRPSALLRKYGDNGISYILTGPGRIADHNFYYLNLAWTRLPAPRLAICKETATYEGTVNRSQEVVFTTFALMRWSNVQYVPLIKTLMDAYPQVGRVSYLRPGIEEFKKSVVMLLTKPVHYQPYWKLLYGDATQIFSRKNMQTLIACAVAYNRRFQPTLANFVADPQSTHLVDDFVEKMRQWDEAAQASSLQVNL